jgi:hypothetical protein
MGGSPLGPVLVAYWTILVPYHDDDYTPDFNNFASFGGYY